MRCRAVVLCALALSLIAGIVAGGVVAQGSAHYQMPWSAMGAGGGTSSSTHYTLVGTIGQGVTGAGASTHYKLGAGFWPGFSLPVPGGRPVYIPFVVK